MRTKQNPQITVGCNNISDKLMEFCDNAFFFEKKNIYIFKNGLGQACPTSNRL
jgi:hypothetical protein